MNDDVIYKNRSKRKQKKTKNVVIYVNFHIEIFRITLVLMLCHFFCKKNFKNISVHCDSCSDLLQVAAHLLYSAKAM